MGILKGLFQKSLKRVQGRALADKPKFEEHNINKRTAIPRKEGQPFFRYDHYFCLMSPTSLQNSMITEGIKINPKAMR